ncbi:MAG: nuclear transport factor 2 family protein [Gemmataceae bacterium]
MSTPDENVARLRHAYQQWHDTRGGSVQTWLDLMADDVRMRSAPEGKAGMDFTRPAAGKAAARAYFAGLAADWELLHYNADEFVVQGDRVVVLSLVAFRFKATGKIAETAKCDVFRFRDGKVAEFFEFFDTAAALAATRPD